MEEYTINEDGEIVKGSMIYSSEVIVAILNDYEMEAFYSRAQVNSLKRLCAGFTHQ